MDPDTPSAEQGMTPISRTFHAGEWYVLSSSHETCVATLRQRLSAAELQLATTHALEKSARLELADAERERDQFEVREDFEKFAVRREFDISPNTTVFADELPYADIETQSHFDTWQAAATLYREAGRVEGREQWIKTEDKSPADGELVMYWMPDWKYFEVGTYRADHPAYRGGVFESERTYGYDDEHHYDFATHWMPQSAISLPAAVRKEGADSQ